jgi:hypothetical protein
MNNTYKVNEEAVKKIAERVYDNGTTVINRNDLEEMFPALKESEGERIRKWLIELVEEVRKANPTNVEYNGMCGEAIVWLEKQGEQKSNNIRTTGYWLVEDIEQKPEWSEEDLCNIERCITKVEIDKSKWENHSKAKPMVDADDELIFWLKSLKDKCLPQPKQEWSEEDEINRDLLYNALNQVYDMAHNIALSDWINKRIHLYSK